MSKVKVKVNSGGINRVREYYKSFTEMPGSRFIRFEISDNEYDYIAAEDIKEINVVFSDDDE